jgi:hypothetical protein
MHSSIIPLRPVDPTVQSADLDNFLPLLKRTRTFLFSELSLSPLSADPAHEAHTIFWESVWGETHLKRDAAAVRSMENCTSPVLIPPFFSGLGSGRGNFFRELFFIIKNLLGFSVKKELESAEREVKQLVKEYADFYQIPAHLAQPLLIGQSMGSVLAHALAIKHGWYSLCFNPLGMGRSARTYGGMENIARANGEEKMKHLSTISPGDWVAGEKNLFLLRHVTTAGVRLLTPDYAKRLKIVGNRMAIHNSFAKYLDLALNGETAEVTGEGQDPLDSAQ